MSGNNFCPHCGSGIKRRGSSLHVWDIDYECGYSIYGAIDEDEYGTGIIIDSECKKIIKYMEGILIKKGENWFVNCESPLRYADVKYEVPILIEDFNLDNKKSTIVLEEGKKVVFDLVYINQEGAFAKLVNREDYPETEGTINLCEDIVKNRKKKLKNDRDLAESLWEGCDGCDENDKEMWIKGFINGLRYNS